MDCREVQGGTAAESARAVATAVGRGAAKGGMEGRDSVAGRGGAEGDWEQSPVRDAKSECIDVPCKRNRRSAANIMKDAPRTHHKKVIFRRTYLLTERPRTI